MIYDCFLFYTELDLLELRFEILDPHVDRFVLLESSKSFTGRAKPLCFAENRDRYARFADKIIHVVVDDDPPDCHNAWVREKHQRNALLRGLSGCRPDDVIVFSDLDEIPNPRILSNLPATDKPIRCRQLYFFYNLNCLNVTKPWWSGTRIVRYRHLEKYSPQALRKLKKHECKVVYNAGWHFSFMGNVDFIAEKLNDFSHQEFNRPELNNPDQLLAAINQGIDILGRDYRFEQVRLDEYLPTFLVEHPERFERFIGAMDRLSELPSAGQFVGFSPRRLLSKWFKAKGH